MTRNYLFRHTPCVLCSKHHPDFDKKINHMKNVCVVLDTIKEILKLLTEIKSDLNKKEIKRHIDEESIMKTCNKIDKELRRLSQDYKTLEDEFFNQTAIKLPRATTSIVSEGLGIRYYFVGAMQLGGKKENSEPAKVSIQCIKQIVTDEFGRIVNERVLRYEYCVLELRWRRNAGRIEFDPQNNNFDFNEKKLLTTVEKEGKKPKQYYITLTNNECAEEYYKGLKLINTESKIKKATAELEQIKQKITAAKKKLNKE